MTAINFIFAGDIVLDEPDPDHWLSGIAAATQTADVTIGHLEVPHTLRGAELKGDVPAPGAAPENLAALGRAGFDLLTLAGNHIADRGPEGISDTRDELKRLGIGFCGAGGDLESACAAGSLSHGGLRIGVLSYNCVGPQIGWATPRTAGCAYVKVRTADGAPVAPAGSLQDADPDSVRLMQEQIAAARGAHDFLIVSLHKGLVHVPAKLAPYERQIAEAAIDAGADVVLGHHAHLIRGIEFYRGKPIYHGLGNGCVVTRALSPSQDHPERAAWARKRKLLFGFEPDPDFWLAPFHPQAVNAMLGSLRLHDNGKMEVGFVPVRVMAPGRPVVASGADAAAVVDYVRSISAAAGMQPVEWQQDHERMIAR
jgi:poly-gamma-glutamate capsule biosynthesis protein CapA/YwtB (metallophosphatase superfamily)